MSEKIRPVTQKKIILASKSPRRREILENLGIAFEIVTAETDESSTQCDPRLLVEELSLRKAQAVRDRLADEGRLDADCVILASDTVVAVDGAILGKPRDAADARCMIERLSGRRHEVISGIALIGNGVCGATHEVTEVEFDTPDAEALERYLATAEPYDKAGAYAIQGTASLWIRGIRGCYFNVVGLPVYRLCTLFGELFGEKIV